MFTPTKAGWAAAVCLAAALCHGADDTDPVAALWLDTAPAVKVRLPEPVVHLNFDGGPRTDEGIAGSRGLDLAAAHARHMVLSDPRALAAIDRAKSFSITGWFRTTRQRPSADHDYIARLGGSFCLFVQGQYPGRLLLLLPKTASGKRATLASSWFRHYFPAAYQDCWAFFAATYDAARTKDNVSFYYGTDRHPAKLDQTVPCAAGPLGPVGDAKLIVGAMDGGGKFRFRGSIDSLRIYASRSDSSAALSAAQVEAVRQADLGRPWIERVVAEKRRERARQPARHRQIAARHWSRDLNAAQVELLRNHFPDWPAKPKDGRPVSVPAGARAALMFVVMSKRPAQCRVHVLPIRNEQGRTVGFPPTIYSVRPVPVEANNNGGCQTSAKRKPNPLWRPYFVREAPFDVAEVLEERTEAALAAGEYHAFVVDLAVPRDAGPAVYRGAARFEAGGRAVDAAFALRVHRTRAPERFALKSIHWLHPEPDNVTTAEPPPWWSEEHWRLLENAGRTLRAFGDTAVLTPVLGKKATVQVTIRRDGSYAFDFTRFDRWIETFSRLGYEEFDGHHAASWHQTPASDERTGKTVSLFRWGRIGVDPDTLAFLDAFYPALYAHLRERGWVERYVQCQLDEPHDEARYRALEGRLRKHMPGVRSKDAINGSPARYSPLVDLHVFSAVSLAHHTKLAAQRRAAGKPVWFYHCCSPYPPYPNRHLDDPLIGSRLYPWLAYMLDAEGYLYWGANIYRGADPYKHSVGPTRPGGYREVGHPPGDNWMFYKYEHGLRPSMRMLAFREGLLDHALLTMLAARDRGRADAIMRSVARSLLDYEREPGPYHAARRALLTALD